MNNSPQPFNFNAFLQALSTCEHKGQVKRLRDRYEEHGRKILNPIENAQAIDAMDRQVAHIEKMAADRKAEEGDEG